jgi:carbamoyl-phosphate synthase large subunit
MAAAKGNRNIKNKDVQEPKGRVVILGGGPNRIGQGIEFDYCCVHAALAAREMGYEAIMVNCNPETVSTDYDISTRLYFEPMTTEDILNILEVEKPLGIIVQFGGQTPLNLSVPLEKAGVKILGTSSDSIDIAEDRQRFKVLIDRLRLRQPANATGFDYATVQKIANNIGYPVLVRPSYVLGGRAMEIVYSDTELEQFMTKAVDASPQRPILIDKFLEDAVEVDVDAVCDGTDCVIGAVMEHVEEAGVHSGDSACVIPPQHLSKKVQDEIRRQTVMLAKALKVIGLINIQFAVQKNTVFILEVNPRASRTVPFVSKAIGVSLANIATKIILGKTLKEIGFTNEIIPKHISVKEAVFPFARFEGIDTQLSPEMKSTGEVMGISGEFGLAFAKAQIAAGQLLPISGNVFMSINDRNKVDEMVKVAKDLDELGFTIYATRGTSKWLDQCGIGNRLLNKVSEGQPNVVDMIINKDVGLIINTPSGKTPRIDEVKIRSTAWLQCVPIVTTVPGATAVVQAIRQLQKHPFDVKTIQEYAKELNDRLSRTSG